WLALDQGTKLWVEAVLPLHSYTPPPVVIIPGFFNIVHIANYGAAWGMLQGMGWLLALLALAFLAGMFFFRRSLELHKPHLQIIFGLIAGGIVGNLIDRVVRGYVVDFFDFIIPIVDYRWPAFNFADIGIVVGVFLYMSWSLFPSLYERR
ncbi:MAG: signal peptidase II, partial [Verrucomicrobiota bacterium]